MEKKIKDMEKKVEEYFKKIGIPFFIAERLVKLQNPATAKRILCKKCFNKMLQNAKRRQFNPQKLQSELCDNCRQKLELYLNFGVIDDNL